MPPPGNLRIGGQQIWAGPALAARQVTIWADETVLHVVLNGTRLKTLPPNGSAPEPPSGDCLGSPERVRDC